MFHMTKLQMQAYADFLGPILTPRIHQSLGKFDGTQHGMKKEFSNLKIPHDQSFRELWQKVTQREEDLDNSLVLRGPGYFLHNQVR